MSVRRLLDVAVATMAFLGALLLGMGRPSAVLPVSVLIAAVASVWLTDVTGRFRLSRKMINAAAVAAVALTLCRFAETPGFRGYLVFADLFVWLQVILLFEEKTLRTRWDLVMLSLAQVAVAGVLSQGATFGVLLVVYLFVGLSVLALLFLYQERSCRGGLSLSAGVGDSSSDPARNPATDWHRLGKVALATVFVGPASLFLRFGESPREDRVETERRAPASARRRWALGGLESKLTASATGGDDRAEVGGEFWGRLTRIFLASLAVTLLIFPVIPRFGKIGLRFPRFGPIAWGQGDTSLRTVGFSGHVALGELGELQESREIVMQAQFIDHATEELYPIREDVYLRGAVLTQYQDGHWGDTTPALDQRFRRLRPANLRRSDGLVRQKITIAPMDRAELFCVWPFVMTRQDRNLWFEVQHERLHRHPDLRSSRFSFELATTAFLGGMQSELAPAESPIDPRPLLQMPAEALPRLAALADQWMAQSAVAADEHLNRARFLANQLHRSNRFAYSLQGATRDPAIDPVEDFIANNPRGNCEYFATALTLMLRSQGIPARMVVGYKCDEYDYSGNFYQVRQLHAHSWVEAYLAPEHLPDDLPHGNKFSDWTHGGWLRLDPTPAASGYSVAVGNLVDEMGNWFERLKYVWANYVVGMDSARQREKIYRPLVGLIKETSRRAVSPRWWGGVFRTIGRSLTGHPQPRDARWFAWRGGLAAIVALGLVFAYRRLRFCRRRLSGIGGKDSTRRNHRANVKFYRRLEAVLARYGLVRGHSQTQREFAREGGAAIARATGTRHLEPLPAQIAEAFYSVRFGGRDLNEPESEAVGRALRALEQAADGRPQVHPVRTSASGPRTT